MVSIFQTGMSQKLLWVWVAFLSKYARIPPSFAGGMNGLPSPLGGEG
jgi:hypothetical protein